MGITISGADRLQQRLTAVADGEVQISRAGVVAFCVVSSNACKSGSPGSISRECGFSVKTVGGKVVGKAGLMRFPRKGDGQDGPHGVYVDQGTKFIRARHFIRQALDSSRARAMAAMRRATKAKIKQLAK
jgi:hypothetical protein